MAKNGKDKDKDKEPPKPSKKFVKDLHKALSKKPPEPKAPNEKETEVVKAYCPNPKCRKWYDPSKENHSGH